MDFLLGRLENFGNPMPDSDDGKRPVPKENLRILHGRPVWCREYGWMIVNAAHECFLKTDGTRIPFYETENDLEVYLNAPAFAEGAVPETAPLKLSEIAEKEKIWVEPVSQDEELREELRGWYRVRERYVENELGNRFYLEKYGVKWLGYGMCL